MTKIKFKTDRKSNRFIKTLLTLALAAVLSLGSLTTAFAAGVPIYGTEANPAQAAITKMLQMPEGTTTPAADFTFVVAKKSMNGSTAAADLALMPAIAGQTVSFTSTNAGTTDAAGLKSVPKEVTIPTNFTAAGVYAYTITETSGTYTIANAFNEQMTYSGGSYDITFYVENGTGGPYVQAIATTIVLTDNPGQTAADKVDATPGGTGVAGDYSKLIFTNTYIKNTGGANPTDSVLSISKAVAGAYADQTKYFTYDLTVTRAATLPAGTVYKAYVLDGANTVVTSTNHAAAASIKTDAGSRPYIEVVSGTPITVNLKHGEKLSFTDAAVGTKYVAAEQAAADYTPTAALVVNGTALNLSGTVGTSLSTAERLIGEAANSAAFTNTFKSVTPTGIALDNLPFIMIIVLAAGVFAAFIVAKSRKRA